MTMSEPGKSDLPLAGVTVVDLTVNIAGPFASLILHDLGARVLKVEPPHGDDARHWPPFVEDAGTAFVAFNRGKESVAVDAKRPEGRDVVLRLVERADVFLESLRPGKAAALGLAWEDLGRVNPHLVYCSVNAFGDVGPLAGVAGFDAIVQAHSGIMDLTGYPDGDPCRVGTAMLDVGTGMWAAIAVLAALLEPDSSRRGGRVQATLLGTAVGYLMHHLVAARLTGAAPRRLGTAQHNFAPYQAIHAKDGMVMVGVNSDRMWQRFCAAVGSTSLADDPRFASNVGRLRARDELIAAIEAVTTRITAVELVERLSAVGVPASVVRPVTALVDDPQVDALGLWADAGDGPTVPRIPVDAAASSVGAVPRIGEHTGEALTAAGMSAAEIARLAADGVLATG
ncbi:MAG: CoA transferase [Streptosporangiales bacterium]|nr:CoA transferase [Streptosporangiales bacterium]